MTVFVGSPGDDSLSYGDPDDHISGMGGNDTIYTGAGNDTLFGGDGNDIVSGDDDNDLIHGDDGHDVLSGGRGDDLMFGGDGNDTFLNAAGNDTCYGGAGDDYVTSVFWNDRAVLESYGGAGNDYFVFASRSDGIVDGGDGEADALRLFWQGDPTAMSPVIVTPTLATVDIGMRLEISGIERFEIFTSLGDDQITTGNLNDTIGVGSGANTVNALGGDDAVSYDIGGSNLLDGGTGNDSLQVNVLGAEPLVFTVTGSSADDGHGSTIVNFETYGVLGGKYADVVTFGDGNDSLIGRGGDDFGYGGAGNDSLYGWNGFDQLFGGDGNDDLDGDNHADRLNGGAGDDDLDGGSGRDVLQGAQGNDLLNGGEGGDRIWGGAGADVFLGGDGDDRLFTGLGRDTLTGGAGADAFVQNEYENSFDLITDFTSGEDSLEFWAPRLQWPPATGPLDPSLLSFETAVGSHAQFVLRHNMPGWGGGPAETWLTWDPNGDDPAGGNYALLRFSDPSLTLTAADIMLF